MIQIDDNDLPIMAAEKLITATKPYNASPMVKVIAKSFTGNDLAGETMDMFDLEELKEIADYLLVYYEAHKDGD